MKEIAILAILLVSAGCSSKVPIENGPDAPPMMTECRLDNGTPSLQTAPVDFPPGFALGHQLEGIQRRGLKKGLDMLEPADVPGFTPEKRLPTALRDAWYAFPSSAPGPGVSPYEDIPGRWREIRFP